MFSPETRIIVIDDMLSIRELVKTHLKTMGFKNILEAGDGEEALKMMIQFQSAGAPVELVISDWNMPKMKGIDLLRQVRGKAEWVQLPFLLLTSESEKEQVTEAVLAGVSQYVVKPFSGKVFEDKLKAAWTKHFGAK